MYPTTFDGMGKSTHYSLSQSWKTASIPDQTNHNLLEGAKVLFSISLFSLKYFLGLVDLLQGLMSKLPNLKGKV